MRATTMLLALQQQCRITTNHAANERSKILNSYADYSIEGSNAHCRSIEVCVCPLTRLSSLGWTQSAHGRGHVPRIFYTPCAFICTYPANASNSRTADHYIRRKKKIREGEKSCINNKDAQLHILKNIRGFCCCIAFFRFIYSAADQLQ